MADREAVRGTQSQHGIERGRCLPDFEFVTIQGVRKRLSDFKGRSNLLLILAGAHDDTLPGAMALAYPEVRRHDGHVIAVLKGSSPEALRWPFDVVVDPGGSIHRKLGSNDIRGEPGLIVYITDRWGEVVFVSGTVQGDPPPEVADLVDWLRFVDQQCPECFPSTCCSDPLALEGRELALQRVSQATARLFLMV